MKSRKLKQRKLRISQNNNWGPLAKKVIYGLGAVEILVAVPSAYKTIAAKAKPMIHAAAYYDPEINPRLLSWADSPLGPPGGPLPQTDGLAAPVGATGATSTTGTIIIHSNTTPPVVITAGTAIFRTIG